MAKNVVKKSLVGVEVVGFVKHDGEVVPVGEGISLVEEQALRLVASGHVKMLGKSDVVRPTRSGSDGVAPGSQGTSDG